MDKNSRILLFGGTFNPIHYGHLIMAQEAIERLSFNRVIFIPSAMPPHKENVLDVFHRLRMTKLAIEDIDYFQISNVEEKREGSSYTIDTIRHFREQYENAEIYWLIGSDTIPELKTWYKIKELVEECQFVVAERNAYKFYTGKKKDLFSFIAEETKDFLKNDIINHFVPLVNSVIEISSTDIRKIINDKKPSIGFFIPKKVEQYIHDNNLYRNKLKD